MVRIPGKNIRYHRLCGGISQAELAAKVGIGKMAISNYECGERVPSMVILKKIAEVLGVSVFYCDIYS
ncbi:MAG TPA: helix-turn-helix transcriptional regulator [Bacillota bacterium]|nr:helix-turn-helix transcriptional regulator [Bacillota bacterium]HQD40174.1 helix-turn-helix transcriptional regulator [Bacillota bacterium]